MTKICFASYEIHPTVPGGCGVLLRHSAQVLLAQGHEVIFLLDLGRNFFDQFNNVDRLQLPNPENCRAYHVDTLLEKEDMPYRSFVSEYDFQSYRFYQAARKVCGLEHPRVIEFFEYCGVAYYSLCAKAAGLDFADVHLAVRLHNTIELIDRQQPDNRHGMDRYVMYGLEHNAMRLAESVLYPSRAFLEDTYLPYYGRWFGNLVHSQPALLDHPRASGQADAPNGILFYGRLFGFKGVDRFIDAAVLYLSDPANPPRAFYLVGYDSHLPPIAQGSYREYLLKKIPPNLRSAFVFTGQLSWKQLGELLPEILFAVTPSFLESFCYAAHELYEAGVPLIVNDLPAFRDSFKDGENALIFDGTVGDLAEKMRRLSADEALRRKITRPYAVAGADLGDFYANPPQSSWMQPAVPASDAPLLVLVLVDQADGLAKTLASLRAGLPGSARVVLMRPIENDQPSPVDSDQAAVWFLGKLYAPHNLEGAALNPTEMRTEQAMLILQAGDQVESEFLKRSLAILARQSQVGYVGSWKKVRRGRNERLEAGPWTVTSEILPFLQTTPFNRFVMRTSPGKLLIDLFDPRTGRLGELDYLWRLESQGCSGLTLPLPLVQRQDQPEPMLLKTTLDYLILRDDDPMRKTRLARFLLTLDQRDKALRRFRYENNFGNPVKLNLLNFVHWLATSRLSKAMDSYPVIKNAARAVVRVLLYPLSLTRRR